MKPNEATVDTSSQALAWLEDQSEVKVESWQVRFARSVDSDKVRATISRVHQWFQENEQPDETAPFADRLAWDLLGGDAGKAWAAEAVERAPDKELSLMSTIDHIELQADQMESFAADEQRAEWSGPLGLEGVATSDNRMIAVGGLTWRELPLALLDQLESAPGHDGAVAVGPITNIFREDQGDTAVIFGEGFFDSGEHGMAARQRMDSGSKRGVSMDLTEVQLDLPDDPEELERVIFGDGELRITSAKIGAATLVAIPAFEDARLAIIGDIEAEAVPALVASGGKLDGVTLNVLTPISFAEETPEPIRWASISTLPKGMYPSEQEGDHEHHLTEIADEPNSLAGEIDDEPARTTPIGLVDAGEFTYTTEHLDTLLASGGKSLAPPAAWFEKQQYTEASPKTIEAANEQGLIRIHGHVGTFGSCHIGREDVCIDVPRGLDYDSFQGPKVESDVLCSDGTTLKAGPIVLDNVHPKLRMKASDAAAHYAYSGSLVAQVRCYEDNIGLQVQGWVLPGVTDEDLIRLRALSLSPDWRPRANANGGRGVVAILAVPVTGFNMGLAASAGAAGEPEPELDDWEIVRGLAARKAAALTAIGVEVPAGIATLAVATDPPLLAARKTAVLARLAGSCGCGGNCCAS